MGWDPLPVRRWGRQNAARGRDSPEPRGEGRAWSPGPWRSRSPGSREATRDTRVGEQPHSCAERNEDPRGQPRASCSSRNPTQLSKHKDPENSESETARGLQKFGNGLPGSRRPDATDAVKDERPSEWPSLRKVALRGPGEPPGFFTRNSPQSRFQDWGRRCSYLVSILPSPPHKKGNLGPARILGNVLCNRLYAGFHRTARTKSQVSGRWRGLCACQQRRQEDEGRASRLKLQLQALSHFRLVSP